MDSGNNAKEYHIYGPPGTGKTSALATRYIPSAVDKHGPDNVIVASFTRAAALEIASKKSRETGQTIPVNPENVGTLHALCYRAFDQPELTQNVSKEWNKKFPHLKIAGKATGDPEDAQDEFVGDDGDRVLAKINTFRAKMIPKESWPYEFQDFWKKWESFKMVTGSMDFTDLIEQGIANLTIPPNNASVMFLDEVQDFTKLEMTLARQWMKNMDFAIFVGDDDQCIYRFKGADPGVFINSKIPIDNKITLKQSYRVPKLIHQRSLKLITRIKNRVQKTYHPTNEEGTVSEINEPIVDPNQIIDILKLRIADQQSVMILASCSYMLSPVVKKMKEVGIPFANRFRTKRGDWNPIKITANKSTAAGIIANFIGKGTDEPYWSIPQFILWASAIKVSNSGLIRTKGKKVLTALKQAVKDNRPGLESCRNVAHQVLTPTGLAKALERNIPWLIDNLTAVKAKNILYPVKVVENFGVDAILKPAPVTVGTIHSVKGGEAQTVILAPDISMRAAYEAVNSDAADDALTRLFYVGMTRAKNELILLPPYMKKGARHAPPFVEL